MPLYGEKTFNVINQAKPRVDGIDKVTGRAVYPADIHMPRMLVAGVLRSGRAHAKVLKIDTSKAKAVPGVHAVVTADDMANPMAWSGFPYLTNHVRYLGDCVAMAAAETQEALEEALAAIEVEYEDLPVIASVEEALAEGAYKIHEEDEFPGNIFMPGCKKLRKGDVEKGFAEADVIIEREYTTQRQEHAYIEPEAVVAASIPGDGEMTVFTTGQNPFMTRRYAVDGAEAPVSQVRLVAQTCGGSFGGKEEGEGLITGRAAYLSKLTGRPVKFVFSREESMIESVKRHPYKIKAKMGLKKDGTITALEYNVLSESGAYTCVSQFVNWKAITHCSGAYSIPNVKMDLTAVYTNRTPSGAFRGFGHPQMIFAIEQLIEEAGEELGLDPVAIRKKNLMRDGGSNATSQVVDHVILEEIVDYATAKTDYLKKHEEYKNQTGEIRKGIGMVAMMRGCGSGAESPDASGTQITIHHDGSVLIKAALAENGQGLATAYTQIAAETLELPFEKIRFYQLDTMAIADSGTTTASRGTVRGAMSLKKACEQMKQIMTENAAELFHMSPDDVGYKDGLFFMKADPSKCMPLEVLAGISIWIGQQLSTYAWYKPLDDNLHCDEEINQGRSWPTYCYGVVIAEVEVDTGTGAVDVKKLTCSHDLGTVINPGTASSQIMGGALQGMGYGTSEIVKFRDGKQVTQNYDKYIIPTAMDMPEFDVNLFECDDPTGTYGAKSIGEPSLDGVAAAVANAVYNATGVRNRNNPCSMERVLLGKELD